MGNFNIVRPVLILSVAYLSYNSTELLLTTLGYEVEKASNIAFLVMMVSTFICYFIIMRGRNRKRPKK